MKHPFRIAIASLALLGAVVGLQAEVALKVATVDMDQLFKKYYKTEAQEAKLREDEKRAKAQIEKMKKDGEAIVAEAKALQEQTKSAILSDEARKKAQADFEAKVGEIREKEAEIQQFSQEVGQRFQQRLAQYQQQAGEEISKIASDIATKKGATLLLNAGASGVVLYADASFDLTNEVLTAINKDRPAPAPTPAPAPASTPAAAPAK